MRTYWFSRGMAFLPIFFITWTYLTFAISYMIAVFRGDIDPGFPYISDTGARRPESSVFGQMLNMSAVVALACVYVRYKQVDGYLENVDQAKRRTLNILNKASWFVGVLICIGMSLVANFQETSVIVLHVIGAMMTFVLGTVYEFVHAYITFRMHPEVNGRGVFYARLAIAIASLCALLGGFIVSACCSVMVKFHWNPNDPGFSAHLASTILEWCLAGSFLAYFYTFIRDFQVITLSTDTNFHQDTLYHHDVRSFDRDADA